MRGIVTLAAVAFAGVAAGQDCPNGRCQVRAVQTAAVTQAAAWHPAPATTAEPVPPVAYAQPAPVRPAERRRPVATLLRRVFR